MPENELPDCANMHTCTVKIAGIKVRIGQVPYYDRFKETFFFQLHVTSGHPNIMIVGLL